MNSQTFDITLANTIVPCQQWETGTGMTGYTWISPNERAILLYQHAFGDYTQRLVHNRSQFFLHLLEQGISVYGIDMPGCGRSPGVRGAVDPNVATQHHLAARSLLTDAAVPVFLAGHSLGGLVTASSLLDNQSNAAGVILIAPALKYGYPHPIRWLANIGGSLVPSKTIPLRNGPVEMLTRDIDEQQKLLSDPLLDARGVSWITAKGTLSLSRKNWDLYSQITVPALAIHGTYDTVTNARGSEEFIDAITSDDKTFYLAEGGRHDLLTDLVRNEVRDVMINWMRERI